MKIKYDFKYLAKALIGKDRANSLENMMASGIL